jgi:uncharacterized protein (DUF1697 family)
MSRTVLLLRGINVGGRNKLTMTQLKNCLESLGCRDVQTYIQSGNATAVVPASLRKSVSGKLAGTIEARHGFAPRVMTVTAADLERIIAGNPFARADEAPNTVHVFLPDSAPEAEAFERLEALRAQRESFELTDQALYLHAPDGIGRSKLVAGVERALGTPATARNWRTIRAIEALLEQKA